MIANPPPWPDGAGRAVAITFDVDSDSFLHVSEPARAHRLGQMQVEQHHAGRPVEMWEIGLSSSLPTGLPPPRYASPNGPHQTMEETT